MYPIPAPGGGIFVGPGGQAPPFAPGGPDEKILDEKVPELGPGAGQPTYTPFTDISISAAGGIGMGLPTSQLQQMQLQGVQNVPATKSSSSFYAQIIPIEGNPPVIGGGPSVPPPVIGGGPIIPSPPVIGGGPSVPPVYPGQGLPNAPVYPGQGLPDAPVIPGQGLPPSHGMGKPVGFKTLPMPKDQAPPDSPPKPPGIWVTVDGGKGQPPAFGFVAQESGSDSGLEPTPKKKERGGAPPPSGIKPPSEHEQKGHYVPLDVPVVTPVSTSDVIWCWIPEISSDYGVKEPEPPPIATPK